MLVETIIEIMRKPIFTEIFYNIVFNKSFVEDFKMRR